jgi:photosystem II stability/assembly factor-like uncharacterized protein
MVRTWPTALFAAFAFANAYGQDSGPSSKPSSAPTVASESKPAPDSREAAAKDALKAIVGGLKARGIGPASCSGRIGDIAVDPRNRSLWYVAVASGGLWKTTNAGTTFEPIFDDHGVYSIGCVTLAPSDSLHVWVGTGENNSQRSVGYGDGVFKSVDGGKSFTNVGLKESEHVGMIRVHPTNKDVVYVAAQGPLWSSGGDRGLFKTTDGGATWTRILDCGVDTGVSEILMDPRDPEILYAVAYQRRRHVWTLHDGGPESGIHKSRDGGASWTKLSRGLPSVHMGRIGLAIPESNGDRIYAIVEAQDGESGVYVSSDAGASFEKRSAYVSTSPQYYQELVCDPSDAERVYSLDTYLHVSDDGGRTWRAAGEGDKHVDNHALIVDPANPDHLIAGCDGGIYESFDRAGTWRFCPNLPVAQFYRACVDDASPFFNVYGGTQDNNTLGGPSRTTSASGIVNSDWFVTVGGDGFVSRVEPGNPDVVYSEWQHGGLIRYDRKTGEALDIKPRAAPGDEGLRWNWDSPLVLSPHKATRLYFAAQRIFKSEDRGDSWTPISGDLSRRLDRDSLQVMGRWWSIDAVAKHASTSVFGNVVALDESPLQEGLLYAGTDDGLVQITEDGGLNWRRVEAFEGVPDMTYVTALVASRHDANVVYATFGNHKSGDFKPYVHRSNDRGVTWTSIASDLPERGNVWSFAEDHVSPNLLFVGTEFAFFVSVDAGASWIKSASGLPPIPVRDIAVQRRDDALVLATFGRGLYVIDDYSRLRIAAETASGPPMLLPVADAPLFVPRRPLGGGGRGFQGATYFTASNPEFGASFRVHLNEEFKGARAERRKEEKKAETETRPVRIPTIEELRAEEREEAATVEFVVSDAAGRVVRRLSKKASKGLVTATWDLRETAVDAIRSGGGEPRGAALAAPGEYVVSAFLRRAYPGDEKPPEAIGKARRFRVTRLVEGATPPQDASVLAAHRARASEFLREVDGAAAALDDAAAAVAALRKAARATRAYDAAVESEARALETRLSDLRVALHGDPLLDKYNYASPPSIFDRARDAAHPFASGTYGPTPAHRAELERARAAFEPWRETLREAEAEVLRLGQKLRDLGAPWTPVGPSK